MLYMYSIWFKGGVRILFYSKIFFGFDIMSLYWYKLVFFFIMYWGGAVLNFESSVGCSFNNTLTDGCVQNCNKLVWI